MYISIKQNKNKAPYGVINLPIPNIRYINSTVIKSLDDVKSAFINSKNQNKKAIIILTTNIVRLKAGVKALYLNVKDFEGSIVAVLS